MNETDVFILADRALNRVDGQVGHDQWDMPMPASFAMRRTDHTPTLREVLDYYAYDDAWVPDMLTGSTMADAGPERFTGDLLGDDPKAAFATFVACACAAAGEVGGPGRDRPLLVRRLHRTGVLLAGHLLPGPACA